MNDKMPKSKKNSCLKNEKSENVIEKLYSFVILPKKLNNSIENIFYFIFQ